jgi:hypothetical protein
VPPAEGGCRRQFPLTCAHSVLASLSIRGQRVLELRQGSTESCRRPSTRSARSSA